MMTIVGLGVLIAALMVGIGRYRRILEDQRNARARYKPEIEAAYTPLALRRSDVKRGSDKGGVPRITGDNLYAPQERATYFRVVPAETLTEPPEE